MAEPENLRQLAERMLALAMKTEDEELAQLLATRASQYLDRARALEHVAQQAERPQPDDPAKTENPEEKE
jgi:hypothetical protein